MGKKSKFGFGLNDLVSAQGLTLLLVVVAVVLSVLVFMKVDKKKKAKKAGIKLSIPGGPSNTPSDNKVTPWNPTTHDPSGKCTNPGINDLPDQYALPCCGDQKGMKSDLYGVTINDNNFCVGSLNDMRHEFNKNIPPFYGSFSCEKACLEANGFSDENCVEACKKLKPKSS